MIQFVDYNRTIDNIIIENNSDEDSEIKLTVSYLTY